MKKIVFAHIEFVIDFTTKEEAIKYLQDNQGKGWHFEENQDLESQAISSLDDNWYDKYIYKQRDENLWTIVVRKPYRDYYPGW